MPVTETSKQALHELQDLGERHKIIFHAIQDLTKDQGDATDSEIMKYLFKNDPNFVRPRRYELVNKLKMVGFSRKRVCQVTGKVVLAWKVLL